VSSFLSEATMRDTARWAASFAADWKQEVPDRIHTGQVGDDGCPRWHPDFERWLTNDRIYRRRGDQQRLRTTKVMRLLRNAAVREYEVLYRMLVLGERLEETTRWLNDRAERNGIPKPPHRPNGPHYTQKDTLALVVAGIAFAKEHW
jgi:hypothetical protein